MSETGVFSGEAFAEHAQRIAQRYEERRQHYIRKLKFRAIIAAVLLVTFPAWFSLLTRWDTLNYGISTFGLLVVHVLAACVILTGILAFALRPFFRYRYEKVQLGASLPGANGVVRQSHSLKSVIYTDLLRFFGDFTMYDNRQISLRQFRGAPNMPDFDLCQPSDYIRGSTGGVTVEISEARLTAQFEEENTQLFSGMLLVLGINDPDMVLRGKFSGKTVLAFDAANTADFASARYDGFQRVALSDTSFNQKILALTTDSGEASRLLTSGFLRSLLKVVDAVAAARHQNRPMDDRIAYALERIGGGLVDILLSGAQLLLHWFKTGSVTMRSSRHAIPGTYPMPGHAGAFGAQVQCALYDGKVLVSIPTPHDLFEPDSIFYPPLTQEDIDLIFAIISGVAGMTHSITGSLPRDMV